VYRFYSNKEEVLKKYPFIDRGFWFEIFVWVCHVISALVWFTVINLLFHQIILIGNDKTFYEVKKAPDMEGGFLCLSSRYNQEEYRVISS
jgi:hypothetical protein